MREINYPKLVAFRNSSETQKKLEKIIASGKASNASEAIRYCIERTACGEVLS